jgi:DNA (cytosine-5)-methyltransferase 1
MTIAANDNSAVTYMTVCSGIEGVSAAAEPLGSFTPVAFSDKEAYSPFATAFLKWKFPHVDYIDDFTTIDAAAYAGKVDLLWASTPCQTWSKAGKNAGLADDRGQLTLNFINLADAISPSYIAWENVKNVLSHTEAFGQFLATLAGEDGPLEPAGKRWTNAGWVCGPTRNVAWRVFDAEYAGLAARRERLFVVASPRSGADPRDILWERYYPEVGGRHPEAGRGAWERIEGEKVRLRSAEGGAGGSDGPFAFNADTSPKWSEIGLTLRADTASGGFQGIALRDESGPRAFRLTPEMMERMLGFPPGWTDMGDAWTGRGRLDIRRRAALGNSLAVPDVRWILERVKASVQGTLELHHWPEPDAANDNAAVDSATVKAA